MAWRNWVVRAGVAAVFGVVVAGAAQAGEVRLPDTGQTQSFTNTVGEDHDTRRPRSYTVNESKGTVIDNVTGLMWQRQDDSTTRNWANAGTYCADLTLAQFADWRLPTKKELQTLIDYGRLEPPAIDTTAFPGTGASSYWSSTSKAFYSDSAWVVDFYGGYDTTYDKTNSKYVRCVRSGQ
jgi:hypothetical protein